MEWRQLLASVVLLLANEADVIAENIPGRTSGLCNRCGMCVDDQAQPEEPGRRRRGHNESASASKHVEEPSCDSTTDVDCKNKPPFGGKTGFACRCSEGKNVLIKKYFKVHGGFLREKYINEGIASGEAPFQGCREGLYPLMDKVYIDDSAMTIAAKSGIDLFKRLCVPKHKLELNLLEGIVAKVLLDSRTCPIADRHMCNIFIEQDDKGAFRAEMIDPSLLLVGIQHEEITGIPPQDFLTINSLFLTCHTTMERFSDGPTKECQKIFHPLVSTEILPENAATAQSTKDLIEAVNGHYVGQLSKGSKINLVGRLVGHYKRLCRHNEKNNTHQEWVRSSIVDEKDAQRANRNFRRMCNCLPPL